MKTASLIQIDINQIMKLLPHRYPILLIDRVLAIHTNKKIVALKNVSINEPFFLGHFPGNPVMPGVLIVEAIAQAAAILSSSEKVFNKKEKQTYYLVGINNAKFRKPVIPGDQLIIEVETIRLSKLICKYKGTAKVNSLEVASAEIMCAVRSSEDNM